MLCIWSIQKIVVTLQSQTKSLQTYYKKRLLALVLVSWNLVNFELSPGQEGNKRPYGICISRRRASFGIALFGGISYSAWALCAYLSFSGFTRTSGKRISKDKVPRFLYIYTNGAFGADVPRTIRYKLEMEMWKRELYHCCEIHKNMIRFRRIDSFGKGSVSLREMGEGSAGNRRGQNKKRYPNDIRGNGHRQGTPE